MKRSYTGTLFHPVLEKAKVVIHTLDKCKYDEDAEFKEETVYTGVTSWDIIEGGEEAEEIEARGWLVDEMHEYLVLHFMDGSTSYFKNSHVDMFVI